MPYIRYYPLVVEIESNIGIYFMAYILNDIFCYNIPNILRNSSNYLKVFT